MNYTKLECEFMENISEEIMDWSDSILFERMKELCNDVIDSYIKAREFENK
jgi:hypothetical protein